MKTHTTGFTLLELLIVLVILGLLAGILAPRVMDYFSGRQHRAAGLQITRLSGEIDRFFLDAGRYPNELEELVVRPEDVLFWSGPYAERAHLKDPWGRPFHYRFPGEHKDYDMWSLGKDGQAGGIDADADIQNWSADAGPAR